MSRSTARANTWVEEYGSGYLSVSSLEFDPLVPDRLWFPEGFGVWRADDVRNGDLAFVCDTLGIEELVANDIAIAGSGTPVTASWDRAFFAHPPGGAATAIQGPSPRFNSAWSLATTPAAPGRVYGIVSDHRFCCEGDGAGLLGRLDRRRRRVRGSHCHRSPTGPVPRICGSGTWRCRRPMPT